MSMVQGSVTAVAFDPTTGNVTFTGTGYAVILAAALAQARITGAGYAYPNPLPVLGQTTAPYSPAMPASPQAVQQALATVKAIANGVIGEANALAGVIGYIQSNASVPATGLDDSTGHPCTGATTVT